MMAVSDREIRVREPYAEGTAFGAAGVYEQLKGVVHMPCTSHAFMPLLKR